MLFRSQHLQRTDTNERVKVLELQSGLNDLAATFRDWQTLSEGTRGVKGLYHVNIDPDARYAMTEAQWLQFAKTMQPKPPTPWFNVRAMNDSDLKAIYHYVKAAGSAGKPAPAYVPPDKTPAPPFVQFP